MARLSKAQKERLSYVNPIAAPTMEALIFDGSDYASYQLSLLRERVNELKLLGVAPRLSVILASKDKASRLYVALKEKAANKIGIEFDLYDMNSSSKGYIQMISLISLLNNDKKVHGIMLQLPLSRKYIPYKEKFLNLIAKHKDVDGLNENSLFDSAVSKAVFKIINIARSQVLTVKDPVVTVLGGEGSAGKSIVKKLKKEGYSVIVYDKPTAAIQREYIKAPSHLTLQAQIIVSATGVPGILGERNIPHGSVVIDVGSPKGDIRFKEVKTKASFITPVPGGVGPMTVYSLLENVVESAYNSLSEVS